MVALLPLLLCGSLQQTEKRPVETPVLPQFYHPATKGPTLSIVTLHAQVTSKKQDGPGTVSIPVPSDYSGQLVVSLKVESEPPGALKSWTWEKRPEKLNWVLNAKMATGPSGAILKCTALVLCPDEPVYRTELKIFKPWLASTACVQSSDSEIRGLCQKLKDSAKDQDDFVRNVVLWVAKNKGNTGASMVSQDAKHTILSGGEPAGKANLCAALLRAGGIAARTIAYMPTWATTRISEQWLTQFWTDDGNWATVDPTIGVLHPGRNSVVVLAIPSPADENRSFDKVHLAYSLGGIPFQAVPELSPELETTHRHDDPNVDGIESLKRFPPQFQGRVMTAGYRRSLKVLRAAKYGQSLTLDIAEVLKSLEKNPGAFAFLLDRS